VCNTRVIAAMDALYAAFGQRLRQARKAAGLSQTALADHVQLSRTSICNIEAGRQHVSLDLLYRIAEALSTAPMGLLPVVPTSLPELPRKLRRQGLDREHEDWAHRVIAAATSGGEYK